MLLAIASWVWPSPSTVVGIRRRRAPALVLPSFLARGWPQAIVVGLLVVLVGGSVSAPAGLATAMIAATCRILVSATRMQRLAGRTRSETADMVKALARDLKAGSTLDGAISSARRATGPLAAPLAADLAAAARLGGEEGRLPTVAGAGEALPGARRVLLAAAALSRRHGIPLAALITGVADGLALEVTAALEKEAAVAGARFSGYLLAALPLLGVALGLGMNANPLPVLLGAGIGSALLLFGVALTCVGLLWSSRIAR